MLEKIIEKTKEGKLKWYDKAVDSACYECRFDSGCFLWLNFIREGYYNLGVVGLYREVLLADGPMVELVGCVRESIRMDKVKEDQEKEERKKNEMKVLINKLENFLNN